MTSEKIKLKNFIAFFSIIIGFFMVMLDSTIVNITLPVMIRFFKSDMETISWVVNGYNLAFAVLLLTGSRLADQFGRKKIFLIGIIFFTITSLLAALSPTVEALIFFRVLQGLSGALLVPVSMPLIIDLFPSSKSGLIIGVWGGVAGIAAASGPALGGIIGEYLNWQWIFFINVPIGIVAIVLIPMLVKESFDPTASRKIDWLGMILLTASMFSITLGLIQANDKGWGSLYIITLFTISILCFITFYFTEKKTSDPMLPMTLFKNVYFCTTNISLMILGAALMCGVFFTAFFLTQVKEFSQLKAGLIITAYPLSTIFFSALSGSFADRLGYRFFAFPGSILICISVYCMSGLNAESTITDIIIRLVFCGTAIGLTFPPIITASIRATPPEKIGMSSAVGNVSRTLGAILGVALLVTAVTHFAQKRIVTAQLDASKIIMSSPVFVKEVKETLAGNLTKTKLSKDSPLPTEQEIRRQFELRRDEAVKKAPSMMKGAVKKVYEKQIVEMSRVYCLVKRTFLNQIATAFSLTYKLSALVLFIGVVAAFFCEPFRKKKVS
jgi:EmrB/QacA subfamily drug resistance transporter